jgi:pimeloyl-CoA dehydrogenase small subunit
VDLNYSDDQRMLKDSIDRLLTDRYDLRTRAAYLREPRGYSLDLWATYAELGLLGVPFEERFGGLGGGAVEVMIVMEAFGRALAVEPFLATVILGGGILRRAGSDVQQTALIPGIAAGVRTLAVATVEPGSGYEIASVATRARRVDGGWILDGAKSVVLHGGAADHLIVPARVSGREQDTHGIGLFLVDGTVPGLERRRYATQDGLAAADLVFSGVRVGTDAVIGDPEAGHAVLAAVVDEATAALCAEAVGAMDRLFGLTLEFLKTRQQFGSPLGRFQALQHRAVDMFVAVEQARSMALYASLMLAESDAVARHRAVIAAKALLGRAARHVGQEATQLHGAMGMTTDYASGHLFKRLTMIDSTFGHSHHHLHDLARSGGLFDR